MVERYRNGRQSDLVDECGNHAEDQPVRDGLGHEMAYRHEHRHAGISPGIGPLPVKDDQSLEHGHDQEQGQEDQRDAVGSSSQQLFEAEVKFHLSLLVLAGRTRRR
jgi:hypothetical protein